MTAVLCVVGSYAVVVSGLWLSERLRRVEGDRRLARLRRDVDAHADALLTAFRERAGVEAAPLEGVR